MRLVGPLVAAVIALGSLTACDAIQGVSNTADKVKLCADAISLLGFSPDMSDPQKALEETQAKAKELETLANSSPDENVKKALEEAANGMQNVNSAADWVAQKADLAAKVSSACGG
ncbi:bacteriophage spanin2 family protein [Lentzea sp. HUAS TT2]|uniref:bacteriophage spanin2 family protein n=1 Tax=Lentzea sp. HUAS TT2 TaxID=3447454 RepID=UPI003F7014E8